MKNFHDYEFAQKFAPLFVVSDEGIGGYTAALSYKVANGDLSLEKASTLTGIPVSDLEGWSWDEHERLAALMTGDYIDILQGE